MQSNENAGQRRAANRARHWEERQKRAAARGPRGIAGAWWDRARVVAADREKAGDQAAWDELSRWLENYCQRYGR